MAEKYGRRNVPKMVAQIETLRQAIRAEGTPAIQDAWDHVEEHIDYAYRGADLSSAEHTARSTCGASGGCANWPNNPANEDDRK